MPATERHIRIHAPIEQVWEVLVDVPGQPRWMRDLRDIRFETPGPLAVGTSPIGTVHMFGLSQSDPIEVTALDAPQRYAIRAPRRLPGLGRVPPGARRRGARDARALARGAARDARRRSRWCRWLSRLPVVGRRSIGASGAARAAAGTDPLFGPVFSAVFRADLRRLKRLVETGAT